MRLAVAGAIPAQGEVAGAVDGADLSEFGQTEGVGDGRLQMEGLIRSLGVDGPAARLPHR